MKIVGCFLEYDLKFLILLRHSHKPNGGTWGLPAGKAEAGEDDKTALIRELSEETGYKADESELLHLGDFTFGDEKPYTLATYKIVLTEPYNVVLEDSAHADFRWVTTNECYELPNLIPDFHELLKRIGQKS
jgi:8-oxo-dGTP pyrophosphatase MutT (NUDIX family)